MVFYNRFSINILALLLAFICVIIFTSLINMFFHAKENMYERIVEKESKDVESSENIILNNLSNVSNISNSNNNDINNSKLNKWCLEIEKIDLVAEIREGTDAEILDDYIGHFSSTPVNVGNVGLAAHNRGYKNNYFSKLKELEIGDKIKYYINGNRFIYEVEEIIIIYESDWSMLNNTKDNRITLITCVENREKYRLCVQAIRIKE